MRFLSGRRVSLTHTFLDDSEGTVTPSSASVTVWDALGVKVAEQTDLEPDGEGFTAVIPKGTLSQGRYRAEWDSDDASDIETFEVVGGHLFTVAEARASDRDLAIAAEFPPEEIAWYRTIVATEFETVTSRSFIPRTRVVKFETTGADAAWLGLLDVNAVTALSGPDGTLELADYPCDANGVLSGLSALPEGTSVVALVDYGLREVPPDIKRAAMVRTRYLMAAETSGIPDRATSYVAAEGGTFTLATPGRNGYRLGIPEVDSVLNLYSYRILYDALSIG